MELRDLIRPTSVDQPTRTRKETYRAHADGAAVRVGRAAFVGTPEWTALAPAQRHLVRMHAVAARRPDLEFSHWSAAAAWQLPVLGRLPELPHVVSAAATGGRSDRGVIRHATAIPMSVVEIDGVLVTSLARTVVDLGRVLPFASAVVLFDHVLRIPRAGDRGPSRARCTLDDLLEELGRAGSGRGVVDCRRAISIADGASGSPGESLSRANMLLAGLPMPMLQEPFRDLDGLIGYTDFWWPHCRLVGEFDGLGKYLREEFTRGRTPAEVVLDEKTREDRLRATGASVSRWGWDVASSVPRLRRHLLAAGVR